MHGLIFVELQKYADAKLGGDAWSRLLREAGLEDRIFLPVKAYPDREATDLVDAAAKATGLSVDAILQDFGEFIVPDLMRMYGSLVKKDWRTLDVIEHTEETIHRVVRLRTPGASPPELRCHRESPTEVVILYTSARRMCGIAKGIIRGLADHYDETLSIAESSCMLDGDFECRISVRETRR